MRKLTEQEIYIINKLIGQSNLPVSLLKPLTDLYCEAIDEGGMGSIKILYEDSKREVLLKAGDIQINYQDIDNIPVNITFLIDENFNFRELDVFKADFSPLCQPWNINNILSTLVVK
ncbi:MULTISPECIES: DUF6984 family protein [Acinetobacter]|uniref:DUF6984 family protein n=1 Tax=Acinetobacter TaxID=469 RepID=UPI0021CD87ED|nr:hypothetical protein [Acinetobacter sp. WU_MDCI_Abxb74]MCU4422745.1 hypothetical protein [Acinetobacter sp. WU_MDCI_Abxb74]CAI3100500.1 hypothetical protein MWMV7_MWMV7_00069 [Acinetobacter calcoaceticus]